MGGARNLKVSVALIQLAQPIRHRMLVVIPFVVNAALNFVLGLLVAWVLGPQEFGLYAIGAALMVVVNAIALDWLKLAAIRFYTGSGSSEAQALKWSLDALVAGISVALSGILVAAVVAGVDFRLPATLVGVAVAAGICAGLFDYSGAIARAELKDRAYARLIIAKNVLALVLMVGGAWATESATIVLLGACLSVVGAMLIVRRDLAREGPAFSGLRLAHVRRFASYALPLVGANILMALAPLLNRTLLASQHGLAEAGYLSLASDMGIKLFGTLGATLEIVLLRAVVRADESEGRAAALKRIADNQVIVLMIVLPIAAGLWAVLPHFEALFVPQAFRGHFAAYFVVMLPAFLALAVTQAAIYPVFMITHRTLATTAAAACGLAANGLVLWWALQGADPLRYAYGLSATFLVILAVTFAYSLTASRDRPPARDLAAIGAALAAMMAVIWPLRGMGQAYAALPAMALCGASVYIAVMLAADVGGCRTALKRHLAARRAVPGPAE
jgi:O-antigen/teichoic acid export membrane protein